MTSLGRYNCRMDCPECGNMISLYRQSVSNGTVTCTGYQPNAGCGRKLKLTLEVDEE